jgi:hypothetical protein
MNAQWCVPGTPYNTRIYTYVVRGEKLVGGDSGVLDLLDDVLAARVGALEVSVLVGQQHLFHGGAQVSLQFVFAQQQLCTPHDVYVGATNCND